MRHWRLMGGPAASSLAPLVHPPGVPVKHILPLAAALALAQSAPAPALAQRFEIQPPSADVVAGAPLSIALSGLAPGAELTLTATRAVEDFFGRRVYSAEARFTAGADGRVDLAQAAPTAGSYQGADLRGLFWSMQPAAGEARDFAPGQVQLTARVAGQVPVLQTLHLRAAAPTLQWRDASPFPGARLAVPAGSAAPGKRPAVIALGGSEGGAAMVTAGAALLASHGFVVLALPYYSPPVFSAKGPLPPEVAGLPTAFADIPVDRLNAARDWLAQQPEVDASRIALHGVSKGAEMALVAASRLAWPKAVVAIVPSDVVWEGWGQGVAPGQRASFSWAGQALPFVPYVDFAKEFEGFQTGQPVIIRRPQDKGRAAHPERVVAARIAVENYAGPLMVVGSHGDQVWDSGGMAQNIAARRKAAGLETVALVYTDAGHALSGTGWGPTTQYNAGPMKMGGNPQADARAQAQAFARTLAFLRETLAR